MRLGVLDIGSNTGHLLVVDAHRGAAPLPAYSYKEPLRLAEHLERRGRRLPDGIEALTTFIAEAVVVAEDKGCEDMLGFATSAVRDAGNCDDVLDHVRDGPASDRGAARRGRGAADVPRRTPLVRLVGRPAGGLRHRRRLARDRGRRRRGARRRLVAPARRGAAGRASLRRRHARRDGDPRAAQEDPRRHRPGRRRLLRAGPPDVAAATSKTFRSLARICGAAPSGEGRWSRGPCRSPPCEWIPKLIDDAADELADLPGVSPSRTHQIVPGALVAEA